MGKRTQLVPALAGAALVLLAPGASTDAGQTAPEIESAPPAKKEEPDHIDYSDQIVWNSYAPLEALFLPQSVLDTTPLEEPPISREDIRRLHERTEFAEADRRHGRPDPCSDDYEDPVLYHRVLSPRLIHEVIAFHHRLAFVFVGTVVDTVQGWSPWLLKPATLVYVRVEEILRSDDDFLHAGHVVAYLEEHGSVEVEGVEICRNVLGKADLAEIGERLLVTGSPYDGHDFFLASVGPGFAFPIQGQKVLPPRGSPALRNAEPSTLDSVREAIQKKDGS